VGKNKYGGFDEMRESSKAWNTRGLHRQNGRRREKFQAQGYLLSPKVLNGY